MNNQTKCSQITTANKQCSRYAKTSGMCTQHWNKYSKESNNDEQPTNKSSFNSKNTISRNPIITITFGDVAENHARMQQIGRISSRGFTHNELNSAKEAFEDIGYATELVHLNEYLKTDDAEDAYILIIRSGIGALLCDSADADELMQENILLEWDKKAKMYGRVVNKHARYNLCYSDEAQEPDYIQGKGRIIPWNQVPLLSSVRESIPKFLGEQAEELQAEGNLYFDPSKCGIGFHGDSERRKVFAIRLGGSMSLHYQWYFNSKPIGERVRLTIHHGDCYVMSDKAVGNDWKKKTIYTLRHAAGCNKFVGA